MTASFINGNDISENMGVVEGEIRAEVLADYARIYLSERDRKELESRKVRIQRRLAEIKTEEGRRAFIESQLRLQLFSLETHRRKELASLELLDFLMGLYEKEKKGGREEE